ncbi:tripartite motif-containing protein 16-like [Clupea harengus]|uniref:Tripartite motif-containing protein 16-like n=1 Tax=Clupea harengus TaxID=7950 RepID=A0A6P8GZQ8_CLUHA|nr:tripartite motif-containing protein 16-like [Clupea harengus]
MAEANVFVSQDQFSCPICLDLLKDPVAIPCGHSFCMDCIKGCWDQEDLKGVHSCPQCRQTFSPRPVLGKNTILADMVEMLKKTGLNSVSQSPLYAGPGDVECDVCIGRKQKAVKSCLVCLASYCETHFRAHNDLNPGKKHKVIDATGKLQDLICSHHDKLLEVFCRTEQTCICLLCVMDEHSGHKTVSAAAERTEKQKQLEKTHTTSQERISERVKELELLRQAVDTLKSSAQAAVEDSEMIFTEMIRSIERRRSELTEVIRDQERAEVSRAEDLMEKLEQEIAELKKRDAELEQLSHTDNHICFLQSFQSLCSSSAPDNSPRHTVHTDLSFDEVKERLSQLREKLEDALQQGLKDISKTAELVGFLSLPEPTTREDFLAYACQLTLDSNTAHNVLTLSEGNSVGEVCPNVNSSYPDHPDRFDLWPQVLCREAVSKHCYWEVEWSGSYVHIAVSYKGLSRKGRANDCALGRNNKSWSLHCSSSSYTFIHDDGQILLPHKPTSTSRIGVYVDHKTGTLSFYSVSDTMTLLHKIHTTFIEPLYPGFLLNTNCKIRLCQ